MKACSIAAPLTSALVLERKLEFFLELKRFAIAHRVGIWDLSYISLKKEKFDWKNVQEIYPFLKKYEIEFLIDKMKKEKKTKDKEIKQLIMFMVTMLYMNLAQLEMVE